MAEVIEILGFLRAGETDIIVGTLGTCTPLSPQGSGVLKSRGDTSRRKISLPYIHQALALCNLTRYFYALWPLSRPMYNFPNQLLSFLALHRGAHLVSKSADP